MPTTASKTAWLVILRLILSLRTPHHTPHQIPQLAFRVFLTTTLRTKQPETTNTTPPPQSDHPSPLIDAALLDLLAQISNFSDDHFDTAFIALDESELELLVALLLQHWTKTLDGRLLAGCLLVIRANQ